jgi:hypothetical protein
MQLTLQIPDNRHALGCKLTVAGRGAETKSTRLGLWRFLPSVNPEMACGHRPECGVGMKRENVMSHAK